MMRNLDLVFAFVFQVTVLGEDAHPLSVLAGALTLSSSFVLGWRAINRKQQNQGAMGGENSIQAVPVAEHWVEMRATSVVEIEDADPELPAE